MHRLFVALVLLLSATGAHTQNFCIQTPAGFCPQNTTSPLGINLAGVFNFSNEIPFLNIFNQASAFGVGVSGLNGALTDLALDANGWPTSVTKGVSGTTYTGGLGIGILQNSTYDLPSGHWTVTCSGKLGTSNAGTLVFGLSTSGTVTCPSTGTNITGSANGNVNLTITADDPGATGNYINALSFVRSDRAALYAAGQIFNPDLLTKLAPFRVCRFMDWNVTTTNVQTTTWASRSVPAQPFYGASTQVYGNGQVISQGVPLEIEVALANQIQCNPWFALPMAVADDYVTNHTTYVAANIWSGAKEYLEYANEPWQTAGAVYAYMEVQGAVAFPLVITGITLGSPTVIAFSAPGGGGGVDLAVGANVTINGITTGPTILNGNTYTITAKSGTTTGTVSINVNTAGQTAWSAGGGVQINGNRGIALSYYSMQAAHVMDLATTAWGSLASTRLIRHYGGQASDTSVMAIELGGPAQGNSWTGTATNHIDAYSIAPYFGYLMPDSLSADATGLTSMFTEINSGGVLPTGSDASTTGGIASAYTLTSSPLCGNGAIPSTPANETVTCMKMGAASTGATTLTVDGGTTYPLYLLRNSNFNIGSGTLALNSIQDVSFTSQTGAATWLIGTTYATGNLVSGSDTNTYISLSGSNVGNNPTTDAGVHWKPLTPAWWIVGGVGSSGGMIQREVNLVAANVSELATLGITTIKLDGYESGQTLGNQNDPLQIILATKTNNDPRMGTAYSQAYYPGILGSGSLGITNHFNDIQLWTVSGFWGAIQSYDDVTSQKLNALDTYIAANPRTQQP